jgi:hypothetical protein
MLRELNVAEQRYQAVLQVLDGIPVTEFAERFGVARQTVHRWGPVTGTTVLLAWLPVVRAERASVADHLGDARSIPLRRRWGDDIPNRS